MKEDRKYTKLMAKVWSILLEYERWEEHETDTRCPYCETSHCTRCEFREEKEILQKKALEKTKELLNKELKK